MKFYMAPMEGITGYVFRNAYEKYFGNIEKYFTPFLTPNQNVLLNKKEKRDILPEVNQNMYVVPQIMTNCSKYFTGLQKELREYGYEEVNLNLGCPAPTVVTKRKGAGFLLDPEKLDRFLYEIFEQNTGKISVKTRLGMYESDEFFELLNIYNQYEMEELIVHPRVREDFYKGSVRLDVYEQIEQESKNSLVYNGDIVDVSSYESIITRFPAIDKVMIGRGLVKNPTIINEILGISQQDPIRVLDYMEEILHGYYAYMKDERNVLFRMKELWAMVYDYFEDGDYYWKKINKVKNFKEYYQIISRIS